ncbi:putative phage infection (PIP) family protein YhgE [Virgibacillus halotolerans]|uniref:YhgE/Pip domain-containing protein n=1 Tax=Virgibacillus halotolerans TaxID=1071053 RepID=UPI00195F3AE0|nr:ABC transporter permease [Virgibacillus halotolerans]MBM7601438.1 putative phage infection (PIP) family protein YhgE [Virgibacillus halotolerans]
MRVLKSFFKEKETLLGISAAIAFQLIFVIVWLTGYNGVYDRTDQFSIGIVNDDAVLGEGITNKLEDRDLFQITEFEGLKKAKQELDERNVNMLIHLPDQMMEQLQENEDVNIDYYINQSTPTLTKQMMETAANRVNDELNQQVRETMNTQLAENLPQMVAAEAPSEDMKAMVEEVASQVVELVQENTQITPVEANVVKTNDKEGFAITVVPLLIVLASYISAMLISQYLQFTNGKLTNEYTRSALFIGRQIINILLAIGISLLTVCLMYLFNIELDHNFFALWGIQAILLFSFLAISQVFVMLFGNPGMIFNIALTAIQLVSSGALVPRELLPSFYQELGNLLPATYGVNSYFSLIYGGGDLASDLKHLSIIIAVLLGIAIVVQIVFYLWDKLKSQKTPTVKN